jgi:hypothetical protein
LFKGIIDNWIKDFKDNPVLFWLELVGIVGGMIAAGTIAFTVPTVPFFFVYITYITGSSCLIIASFLRNNGFWVILNFFFVSIDVMGICHLLENKFHVIAAIEAFLR